MYQFNQPIRNYWPGQCQEPALSINRNQKGMEKELKRNGLELTGNQKILAIIITVVIGLTAYLLLGSNQKLGFNMPPEIRKQYNDLSNQYSELDVKRLEVKKTLIDTQTELQNLEQEIQGIADKKKAIEEKYLTIEVVPIAEARHAGITERVDLSVPVEPVKSIPKEESKIENNKLELIKDYLLTHAHQSLYGTEKIWVDFGVQYSIKPEVSVCIAWADTRLGKGMSTSFNYGNVGNNDRGNRVHFNSKEQGIEKIFQTLNNNYLKNKQTVGSLSIGGGGTAPVYATSQFNWNSNLLTCLCEMLDDQSINESYEIRTY
jgi:hypothetical protein